MSVRALTWSFNLRLQDMAAKAVLHALADHADESGKCWPSLARIARFAGCSESTARRALQRIEALGIVRREAREGQSDIFHLNSEWDPLQADTPVKSEGVSTGAEPLSTRHPTPVILQGDPCQADTRTVKEPPKNRQVTTNERATRLDPSFRPSPDLIAFAEGLGLDNDEVWPEFRDYWIAVPGARGRKLDWEATYRNRCRELAGRRANRPQNVRSARALGESAAFARAGARLAGDEPL